MNTPPPSAAAPQPTRASFWAWLYSPRTELRAALLSGALLAVGYLLSRLPDWHAFGLDAATPPGSAVHLVGHALIWFSLAVGFVYGGRAAWESLAEGNVDIDVLMIVGAGLAAAIGHPEEGALLLFLFVLAGALEELAMARTRREVEALHKLMPTHAVVLRDGQWIDADPTALLPGERVKIKPGEQVPADCRLVQGESAVDQSALTGESIPRPVVPGDDLYAGTINTEDPLEAVVTRTAAQSSLQHILNLVTTAREQREPVQRFIDRVSGPYAWSVMGASALVFLVWWLALAFAWTDAALIAITLLIVASPCALIIATPTATLSAIARGARSGVLFKGGASIERLAQIDSVCFDKTGTLTFGKPRLEQVHAVAWSDGKQLLALAAALEGESTHPIASAVRAAAEQRGLAPVPLTNITHTTGRGMSGFLAAPAGSRLEVRLGSVVHTDPVTAPCLRQRIQDVLNLIQQRGQIGVVIAVAPASSESPDAAGQAAVLILSDAVRPGARTLVAELHALGVRPVRMLTGDNRTTAARVAAMLDLDAFDAELLPADKLRIVQSMSRAARSAADQTAGRPASRARLGVAVIGDGVNDAPALAAADVSLAIGSIGSDAALESADIVLLNDDLSSVPWALRLARAARRTVALNFTFALSVIGVMGILTLVGSLTGYRVPLGLGVLAHEGGTLLVVANSLRLLAFRSPRSTAPVPPSSRAPVPPTVHSSPAARPLQPATSLPNDREYPNKNSSKID